MNTHGSKSMYGPWSSNQWGKAQFSSSLDETIASCELEKDKWFNIKKNPEYTLAFQLIKDLRN